MSVKKKMGVIFYCEKSNDIGIKDIGLHGDCWRKTCTGLLGNCQHLRTRPTEVLI